MHNWFILGGLALFVAWTRWDSHRQTQAILRHCDKILADQDALLADQDALRRPPEPPAEEEA